MVAIKFEQKLTSGIKGKNKIKQLLSNKIQKMAVAGQKSEIVQNAPLVLKPQTCLDVVEIKAPKQIENYHLFEQDCRNLPENAKFTRVVDIKHYFSYLRVQAHRNGNTEKFCEEMTNLTTELTASENISKQRLGKIFVGELIKTQSELENYPEMIKLAKKGVELSEKANDKVHVLARLHDLKNASSKLGDKTQCYESTKKALECVDYIINNYAEASNNFQSLTRRMAPIESFLQDKAYLKADLACMIAHKKRNKAINYLVEAKEIYKKLNFKKDVRFIEVQLERIKSSLMINKLQKYDGKSMSSVICNKIYRSDKTTTRIKRVVNSHYKNFTDAQ